MKMKRGIALMLSLALAASLMLTGCGGSSSSSSGEETVSVTYGTASANYSSFFFASSNTPMDYINTMLYDMFFEIDDVTAELTSRIFSEYEWLSDTELKLVLKDGITFSNGTVADGEDVIYSLQVMVDNGTAVASYFVKIDFDSAYVEDDGLTVHIVYSEPYGGAITSMTNIGLMNKDFCEEHPDGDEVWWTEPVGSGPYTVTKTETDSYYVFSLRDDYWYDEIEYTVDEIKVVFYSDSTTMWVDYQNGVIDVAMNLNATQVSEYNEGGIEGTLAYVSTYDVPVLTMNENNEYLQDIEVRKAISYAIDFEAVAQIVYGDLWEPATSHFTPEFACYEEHESFTYDPDYALEILEAAGYSADEITLTYVAISNGTEEVVAEAVQSYLQAIGITVDLQTYDQATGMAKLLAGETDLGIFTSPSGNEALDPENLFSAIRSTGAFVAYTITDETFNGYLEAADSTVDEDERAGYYAQADQWLYDNYMALPYCQTTAAFVYNDRIESIELCSIMKIGRITMAE